MHRRPSLTSSTPPSPLMAQTLRLAMLSGYPMRGLPDGANRPEAPITLRRPVAPSSGAPAAPTPIGG